MDSNTEFYNYCRYQGWSLDKNELQAKPIRANNTQGIVIPHPTIKYQFQYEFFKQAGRQLLSVLTVDGYVKFFFQYNDANENMLLFATGFLLFTATVPSFVSFVLSH